MSISIKIKQAEQLAQEGKLDKAIESNYKELLVIISRAERDDVGLFAHYLTISKRMRDKLKNFIQLL